MELLTEKYLEHRQKVDDKREELTDLMKELKKLESEIEDHLKSSDESVLKLKNGASFKLTKLKYCKPKPTETETEDKPKKVSKPKAEVVVNKFKSIADVK
jgi:predicted nuclease with TOPRIM domain